MPPTIQHKDIPITATPQFRAISLGAEIQSNTMLACPAEQLERGVDNGCSPWAFRNEVKPVQDDFGLTA